jgi:HSP20 family molecular chaperone IbpA
MEMIDAKYEDGLLNITIPKTEMKVKAATKQIEVK